MQRGPGEEAIGLFSNASARPAAAPDEKLDVFDPVGMGENFSDEVVKARVNVTAQVVPAYGWVLRCPSRLPG